MEHMMGRKQTCNTGVDNIGDIDRAPQVRMLIQWFPGMSRTSQQAFERRYNAMKVLLDMSSRSVHCEDWRRTRDLKLNKNTFQPTWVFPGCTPAAHPRKGSESKAH